MLISMSLLLLSIAFILNSLTSYRLSRKIRKLEQVFDAHLEFHIKLMMQSKDIRKDEYKHQNHE